MNRPVLCCKKPAELMDVPSPFSRILALGFYDGPTSGVLQCSTCSAVYKFDMLDWDDDHEVRIFRLAPVPPDSLDRCVSILAAAGPPRWPVWVPSRQQLPSEEAREAADRSVQQVLDRSGPPDLVVAWRGYGETVLAARRMSAEELSGVPDWFSLEGPADGRDWFPLLGLVKGRGQVPTR